MPSPSNPAVADDPTNLKARAALTESIRSECALMFAGAGFSAPAGFPTWTALLEKLEQLCARVGSGFTPNPELRDGDPLEYANTIQDHVRRATGSLAQYEAELQDFFKGPPQILQFHRDTVALPFRGFLTTNYDNTIQTALAKVEHEPADKHIIITEDNGRHRYDYLSGLPRRGTPRMVAHLHGYYWNPETIVLSARDYSRVYGTVGDNSVSRPLPDFLQNILSIWGLVFIGFSLKDPRLVAFLDAATARYQLWNRDIHFVLLETTTRTEASDRGKAEWLKSKYGVRTVFYDNTDGTHRNLYELIRELREQLAPSDASFATINARMMEGMTT